MAFVHGQGHKKPVTSFLYLHLSTLVRVKDCKPHNLLEPSSVCKDFDFCMETQVRLGDVVDTCAAPWTFQGAGSWIGALARQVCGKSNRRWDEA